MESPVDKIKERLSIADVISSYVTIIESGKNFKARCPFHNEKTPSFFISPDRGTYYCFGCGAKGDIFSFVEKFEGIDFLGSLKLLAARAGIELKRNPNANTEREKTERYYEIMDEAATYYESALRNVPEARSYLLSRGLTDESIKSFRIGFAPDSWRSVSDHLVKKGYDKDDLETVGLIKKNDNGFYDRFRSRIMFPICDSSSRVIAFSGRIFGAENTADMNAKYLNSPDTPLFYKSNVLFGIDRAKQAIRGRGYSIIVEGQMDLILSHQAKFENTVALSGTALSESTKEGGDDSMNKINNLGLVRRLSPNVIFAFDGDEAGIRAASRSAMIALSLSMQVKIAVLPEGKDPADIISSSPDIWKDIIKNSINIVSFHINRICKSTDDMRVRGRKIREIVFPFLFMIESAIERSAYIAEIHDKTGLSERAIMEDFETYKKSNPESAKEEKIPQTAELTRRSNLERKLMGVLFWQEDEGVIPEFIREYYDPFATRVGDQVLKKIQDEYEPFRDTLAFEAEMWYGNNGNQDNAPLNISRDIKEVVLNLEEEILKEIKATLAPLDTEEKMIEFNRISKRIEEIKGHRLE